jgi:hypothetical protein
MPALSVGRYPHQRTSQKYVGSSKRDGDNDKDEPDNGHQYICAEILSIWLPVAQNE